MAKIAIVGRGWGARVQAPAFRAAGLQVMEPVGRDEWRSVVDAPDVDVVTVVLPPSRHLEIATAALQAGKHVLCEKPTALNTEEAEQLLATSRRAPDRLALIDHELRFLPAWRAARERIGEIGALRYVEVRYASPNWGDASKEWKWWNDAAQGGGIWGAVGSHFIDTLRYLGIEFEAVQATMHTAITERPHDGKMMRSTADEIAAVHARFAGGAIGLFNLSAIASGADEPATITIHGENAAMRLTGEELQMAKRTEPFRRVVGNDMEQRPGNSPGGAFGTGTLLLAHALTRALDEGDRTHLSLAATFEDGLAQQKVLDAARASSANEGRWERV